MINKFQEGGQAQAQQQQLDQIFAMLEQQPKETVQLLAQNGMQKEQILQLLELGLQQNKISQNTAQIVQGLIASAKKGAKLNYLKKITNSCPEGTQLVYYKAGGHICPKCEAIAKKESEGGVMDNIRKELNGGQAPKKAVATKPSDSSIKKPKQPIVKKVDAKKQTKPQTNSQTTPVKKLDPKTTKTLPGGKYPSYWTSNDRTTWESIYGNDGTSKDYSKKCGGKMKKDKCGSKLVAKNGIKAKACPKCGKVHSGKCGCKATKHQFGGIIEAMKKFQKGGSLKGIPFIKKASLV